MNNLTAPRATANSPKESASERSKREQSELKLLESGFLGYNDFLDFVMQKKLIIVKPCQDDSCKR